MSKLTKKFRQLAFIKFLISIRKNLFHNIKGYNQYRRNILKYKWQINYYLYPRYWDLKKIISKSYENIKIYRPESTFSEFDLAITANEKSSKRKMFIQIITQKHFRDRGEGFYQNKIESFQSKRKCYERIFEEVRKSDPVLANFLVRIEKDFLSSKFSFFVSEFKEFIPLFKMMEDLHLSEEQKNSLIRDCKFYSEIFTNCEIAWLDATPHNIMLDAKTLRIVPIDFANEQNYENHELNKINTKSLEKIEEFIRTLKYPYDS